ncbi:hypothetical protein D3C72_831910 [compost metagenome]
MVSENTSEVEGFSRKRSMRPSSLVITTPNSTGLDTRVSTIDASDFFSLWKAIASVRSMSVRLSPEMTTKVSSSMSSMAFTQPAVPKGIFSSTA